MKKGLIIGILLTVIIVAVFGTYQFVKPSSQPTTITGTESLQVFVLGPDNKPVQNLEVDLWTEKSIKGPPTAGFSTTDVQGTVTFNIPGGNYLLGFNQIGFPESFVFPTQTSVIVSKGQNQKTITLVAKS